ncbi:MAG TPA: hypothetical protein VMY87_02795 [Armatimonadota bacterium]|nr:hypothetical protein [Armatimonadota bacterium]
MPFCPNCRCEYRRGVRQCPDCRTELVDALPSPAPPPQVDFTEVELCTIQGEIHAKLLQGILAREGVLSRLAPAWPLGPSHAVKAPWPIGGGYDDALRIMVNPSDLAKAKVIHDDYERNAGSLEEPSPSEDE